MNATRKPLTGKVAWVTGSSRGLGRVIAGHLGRLGAAIVVHGTSPTSTRAFGEGSSPGPFVSGQVLRVDGGAQIWPA